MIRMSEFGARILISRGVPTVDVTSMGKAAGASFRRVGWIR